MLMGNNPFTPYPLASLSKLMTVFLVMEAIEKDRINMDDLVYISRRAARIGGSQVYLKEGEVFTVEELLKACMIFSANDCAYALAEYVAGSEKRFVYLMNKKAEELELSTCHFFNPHGLPGKKKRLENIGSAFDIARLASKLLKFREVIKWSSTWQDTFREGKFLLINRNKLIKRIPYVDGLKTGYSHRAKFNIVVSAHIARRRIVIVVLGAENPRIRYKLVKQLLRWTEDRFKIHISRKIEDIP